MVAWQNSPNTSTPLDATTLDAAFAETLADAAALIAAQHTADDATYAAVATLNGKAEKPGAGKNSLTGWFHADGFGVTAANTAAANDTAFAAAFAAMDSGDTLYIPAGLYKFSTFSPAKAVHIKGSGNSHVFNQKAFGYANWTDGTAYASDFISGTVLQSTVTTGSAIFLDNVGLLNNSAISDLVLVGPGSGSSIGITVGDPTSAIGYPVRTRLNNVAVCNFAVGIDATCENATWNGVYIDGCSTGMSTHYPFNGNTINGLNIEMSTVRALSMEASDGNVFNGGVIQGHSAGAAIYLRGCWANRFFFYIEGGATTGPQEDVVLEQDTGAGHTLLQCQDNIIDGFWATHASAAPVIRIDANSVRNEFRGSGPHAAVTYDVNNAGQMNTFLMNISGTVTDTGRNNTYRDHSFSAGTFLPFTLINGTASMLIDDNLWIQTVAAITTHLPDPTVVRKGKVLRVKNGTTGTTTVDSNGTSKTIDGAASITLAAWAAASFVSDGTQWLAISGGGAVGQAYTPAWTAPTTNPVLGNGTLTGTYTQIGKTVHYRIVLTMGSTTTYGSGAYVFSLPVPSSVSTHVAGYGVGFNLTNRKSLMAYYVSSTAVRALRCSTDVEVDQAGLGVAWASGHVLTLTGTYEAA